MILHHKIVTAQVDFFECGSLERILLLDTKQAHSACAIS